MITTALRQVTAVSIILFFSYVASLFWWNVWMYKGVVGPIPLLHWFFSWDGEGSYLLTEIEMFIHISFIAVSIYSLLLFYKTKQ